MATENHVPMIYRALTVRGLAMSLDFLLDHQPLADSCISKYPESTRHAREGPFGVVQALIREASTLADQVEIADEAPTISNPQDGE